MSGLPRFDKKSKAPGVYDNRDTRHKWKGQQRIDWDPYIVRDFDGRLHGSQTREAARSKWRAYKERQEKLSRPPEPREPVKKRSAPPAKAAPADSGRLKAVPEKLHRKNDRRRKRRNKKLDTAPRDVVKKLAEHRRKQAAKVGSRNKKWVCSKCGQIIRVSCLRYSPGTIVHAEKWDKETQDFVPCKGIFYPVE